VTSDFLVHLRPFTVASIVNGLFAYLVPLALAAAWAGLAFVSLAERAGRDERAERTVLWGAAILLLPWLGGAAYLLVEKSDVLPTARRTAVASALLVIAAVATHFWLTRS